METDRAFSSKHGTIRHICLHYRQTSNWYSKEVTILGRIACIIRRRTLLLQLSWRSVVCLFLRLSVGHNREPCKSRYTDRGAIWRLVDSGPNGGVPPSTNPPGKGQFWDVGPVKHRILACWAQMWDLQTDRTDRHAIWDLKPSFSTNPSHCSLSFSSSALTT